VKIIVLALGTRMPAWVESGVDEYLNRFTHEYDVEIREIRLPKRGKNLPSARTIAEEGEKLLAARPSHARLIALDERGKSLDSREVASELKDARLHSEDWCFMIGGPDGLAQDCLTAANATWSLSKLTLPHPLVRIVLIEQLYRAATLLAGHPYHR